MPYSTRVMALVAAFVMTCTAAVAQCEFLGVVTSDGATYCSGVSRRIVDPCTGWYADLASTLYDLTQYTCSNIRVLGPPQPDVECSGCEFIDVQQLVPEPPACLIQVPSLDVMGGAASQLTWTRWMPCINRYDLIRGDVGALRQAGPHVDLGSVVCLANDWTSYKYFQDVAVPPAGQGFFYLVRGQGGIGTTTYGLSSLGADEIPSAGDCF